MYMPNLDVLCVAVWEIMGGGGFVMINIGTSSLDVSGLINKYNLGVNL